MINFNNKYLRAFGIILIIISLWDNINIFASQVPNSLLGEWQISYVVSKYHAPMMCNMCPKVLFRADGSVNYINVGRDTLKFNLIMDSKDSSQFSTNNQKLAFFNPFDTDTVYFHFKIEKIETKVKLLKLTLSIDSLEYRIVLLKEE